MPSSSDTNVCSILCAVWRVEYREEPCKSALNPVKGMGFKWSLNPYMGCVHRCTFCYVRHFEHRSDRPSDDRYGTSIRVKVNVAEVLRRELARAIVGSTSTVAIGAATDPYQPAEGRYQLTRALPRGARATPRTRSAIITRGPMIVRDLDVLVEAARRADVSVTFSIPTLDERRLEAHRAVDARIPGSGCKAVKALVDAGVNARVGMAPILPGHLRPARAAARGRAGSARGGRDRASGRTSSSSGRGRASTSSSTSREDWPEQLPRYERLYAGRKAYLGSEERNPLRNEVSASPASSGSATGGGSSSGLRPSPSSFR